MNCVTLLGLWLLLPGLHDDDVMSKAEKNMALTNQNIAKGKSIVQDLRATGLLGTKPFGTPIDFLYSHLHSWNNEIKRKAKPFAYVINRKK